MSFSEKILQLRKSKGLDQIKVAKELGVSRQSMYKWESGACMPELDKIKKMAEIYGVTYDYLLNDNIDSNIDENASTLEEAEPQMIPLSEEGISQNKNTNRKLIIVTAFSIAIAIIMAVIAAIILIKPSPNTSNGDKQNEVETIVHTYQHELIVARIYESPSCEANGRILMQCKEANCDYFELVVKNALGHSFDENYECTRCDYIKGSYGIMYATDDGHKYYVKDIGKCTDENIVIANKCNGKDVIGISDNAFRNKTSIVSVKIPSSIETIADDAFYGCTSLESVTFGESVKTIGKRAFYNCIIKEVILPDSVETIDEKAFYNNKIEKLRIGKNASYIGVYAFYNNPLTTVEYNEYKSWNVFYNGNYKKWIILSPDTIIENSKYALRVEN